MTIYLPPDLARRLSVHAAESDIDVSRALAEIIAGFLEQRVQG